ncbi:MAG: hypothetical protein ABIJ83_00490 [Patescibacteria group bacterium]|nr:hypothetical protein [Patescibacteria group bacterium]MBU0879988.1 hypothetical protein [Patescibacteria group bacterium]MBU1063079.1 hypothetical protein [Patescibacteria group bacterium]MBU1783174.1 hypothetical protein [Patescibacteria group bacterium]
MKHKIKNLTLLIALMAIIMPTAPLLAEGETASTTAITSTTNEASIITDINSDAITATDIGVTNASQVNNATKEETKTVATTGTIIEIGDTTAENTTIVVRTTDKNKKTEDIVLEVQTTKTSLLTNANTKTTLNDWLIGDQITFTAKKFLNSGKLEAKKIINKSFKAGQKGINGVIKEIRADKNTIDVNLGKNIFTLNLTGAKVIVGTTTSATIKDLLVGDRIRVRAIDDKDKNPAAWKAKNITVLRRDNHLLAPAINYVISVKIISLPTDLSLPTMIEAEVLPSKFYKKNNSVDNSIMTPGTKISINIDNKTILVRRFFGKALLSEMNVGDTINVVGKLNKKIQQTVDEINNNVLDASDKRFENHSIDAKIIKDESIQVLGVAQRLGQITAIDTTAKTVTITILPKKSQKRFSLAKYN